MNETLENSLRIAKLLYQKGDFLEAHAAFVQSENAASSCHNLKYSLESIRLQMQCLSELDQFEKAEPLYEKLSQLCNTPLASEILAQAHSLLAFYFIQKRQIPQAQTYLEKAIQLGTASQDYEGLARSLMLAVYLNSITGNENWDYALANLEKVDLLLSSITAPDIALTCLLMRAHIATRRKLFTEASHHLWRAYGLAQTHGHHLLIPSLLFQLGRLHQDIGQKLQAQLFFELSLRGVDPVKHPRQYRLISQEAQPKNSSSLRHFDFIVNKESHSIQEKQRGFIDFKNQHTLLDLALLFLKYPGRRYSKEEVIQLVWNQTYAPNRHDNLIYVSIKRLRSLIEPRAESPQYILRDRQGYYLNAACSVSFESAQENRP